MSSKIYHIAMKDRPNPILVDADEIVEPSVSGSVKEGNLDVQSFYILKKGGEVVGKFQKDKVESRWID